jgi:hypothetical protein
MMLSEKTALLVVAFNRPHLLKKLLANLIDIKNIRLYVAIDGPRIGNSKDIKQVEECLKIVDELGLERDIEVLSRQTNLGVRRGIPNAINWVLRDNSKIIIIEEDVIPTLNCINFLLKSLDDNVNNKLIGHISGYNLVPENHITKKLESSRLSIYPESFCWATWKDRWSIYSDDLIIPLGVMPPNSNLLERIYWNLCFYQARLNLVDTWAYRWVYALWTQGLLCISPNRNLSTYHGWTNGTHTFRKSRFYEPELGDVANLENRVDNLNPDLKADKYLKRKIFKITFFGILLKVSETMVLLIFRKRRYKKLRKYLG